MTYLRSFVAIAHDIIMASRDIVGKFFSVLLVYSLWNLLSKHPLALMHPSHFCSET